MELCEVCRVNTATIHLTQIQNGETLTRHICEECAEEEGIPFGVGSRNDQNDDNDEFGSPVEIDSEPMICTRCGTTEDQLAASGEVGCPKCYDVFRDFLDERSSYLSAFRRYDGKKYRHSGSRSFQSELDTLRRELGTAITEQRFETAAVLRDRILELESREEDSWN